MASVNGSFASPAADASLHAAVASPSGLFMALVNNMSGWGAVLALFLFAVAYDQCQFPLIPAPSRPFFPSPLSACGLPVD